jgi:hypothetical protein
VQQALQEAARGRSVVVIAHRLSTVSGADMVAVVQQGQITESGAHASLMAAGGAYSQLVQRQVFTGGPAEGLLLEQGVVDGEDVAMPSAAEEVGAAAGVQPEVSAAGGAGDAGVVAGGQVAIDAERMEMLAAPAAGVVVAAAAAAAAGPSSSAGVMPGADGSAGSSSNAGDAGVSSRSSVPTAAGGVNGSQAAGASGAQQGRGGRGKRSGKGGRKKP